MPETLNPNALSSLLVTLDELGLGSDGAQGDDRIVRYINGASQMIARHCGREFQRANGIEESHRGYAGTELILRRPPVLSIDSIRVRGTTLSATEFEIRDSNAGIIFKLTGWPWTASLGIGPSNAPILGSEEPAIDVCYSGGFVTRPQSLETNGSFTGDEVTLPSDLEYAMQLIVQSMHKSRGRDRQIINKSVANPDPEAGRPSSLSATYAQRLITGEVAEILSRYEYISHA